MLFMCSDVIHSGAPFTYKFINSLVLVRSSYTLNLYSAEMQCLSGCGACLYDWRRLVDHLLEAEITLPYILSLGISYCS